MLPWGSARILHLFNCFGHLSHVWILQKELLKEQQIYRAYLAEQLEEDKRQEKEMEKLREEETAKMWAKRAEKDRAAKQARECLLQEVMDTRRLQIEEKCKVVRNRGPVVVERSP